MLWKGRLSFKQYIISKRSRFEIKIYLLCDVSIGIVLDFVVYTGATTNIRLFMNLKWNLLEKMIQQLISIIDYNSKRGAIDKADMQISCVECIRKSVKWYKK